MGQQDRAEAETTRTGKLRLMRGVQLSGEGRNVMGAGRVIRHFSSKTTDIWTVRRRSILLLLKTERRSLFTNVLKTPGRPQAGLVR